MTKYLVKTYVLRSVVHGGAVGAQILADQLTLSQPGGQIMPT